MIKSTALNTILIWLSTISVLAFQDPILMELDREAVRVLSHEESLEHQKKVMAEQSGLPFEEVDSFMAFQEAFGAFADQLYDLYPDRISYIRMEEMPARYGIIQFIGEAPAEAFQKMNTIHQLGGEVILFEDGEFTYEQHVARAELATEALKDLGYSKNHMTYFDSVSEKIMVKITLDSTKRAPRADELADALQARINGIAAKTGQFLGDVFADDLKIEMVDYPVLVLMGNYAGGHLVTNNSGNFCTAAFTIIKPGGTKGFMTAGHCNLNKIHSSTHIMNTQLKQDYHNSTHKRDLEWHTVNGHTATKFFQSSASNFTVNNGWKPTAGMQGSSVCRYGKSTNFTSCNHTVTATGVSGTVSGVTVNKLATTTNNTSQSGDSGGPWFVGGQAWGINVGASGSQGVFTQIEAALNKIGADIYD